MNFIAIDTETGGTRPGRHALLSIAAYASWDLENPLILHLWPADESYVVEPEAAKINGYTPELWKERGAMWIFDAMATLADWLAARFLERRGALMLAHNAGFDRMFLDEASHFTGIRMPIRHAWRCSMDKMGCLMDLGMIAPGKVNLDRLGVLSGQWPEGGRPAVHEAGADALACLRGYLWLLDKERQEIGTLRQLYTDGLKARRALEDLLDGKTLSRGGSLVLAERIRQISAEGWTAEHDDRHDIGELCSAAGAYLFAGDCLANAKNFNDKYECTPESLTLEVLDGGAPVAWPWEAEWFKVDADPVRNLVKCGALVLAEIDRLLRLRNTDGTQPVPTSGKEGC